MHNAVLALTLPMLLLAGCKMEVNTDEKTGNQASMSIDASGNVSLDAVDGAQGVSISVPGFDAKVKVPGLELGGDNMDIGGMKLYPGTKLSSINVTDHNAKMDSGGVVDMRFESPASPDKVAAYYAAAAKENDYTNIKVANAGGTSTLTATRDDGDQLTIAMAPGGAGTKGKVTIRDAN